MPRGGRREDGREKERIELEGEGKGALASLLLLPRG